MTFRGGLTLLVVCGVAPLVGPAPAAGAGLPEPARQYRVTELAVETDADPAASLDRDVIVSQWTGPDGSALRVPAFWDGGRTWRVRFTPTRSGRWTYRIVLAGAETNATDGAKADAGRPLAEGELQVQPAGAAEANPLHRHGPFLKVAPGKRHLTYTDGTPFFWLGDTWWFCPSDLVPIDSSNRPGVPSMVKALVDKRAAQRFTVLHMAFLGGFKTPAGRAVYQDLFRGAIRPAYWQQADRYIRYASAKGLVPVIGFGFHQSLSAPTLGQLKRLWRYALARYGAMGVGFLVCGEYNQASEKDGKRAFREQDRQRVEKILALGRFIKARDPWKRAMTVHPWWCRGDRRQAWDEPWYDFIMLQGGHGPRGPDAGFYRDIYGRASPKPLLEGECTYEGIHGMTADVVRRNAYKAIQAGCFGYTYGAHGLWYPTQNETDTKFDNWGTPVPWWRALAAPGADHMTHLRGAYERVAWWRLVPVAPGRIVRPKIDGPRRDVWVKADGDGTFVVYWAACEKPSPPPSLTLEVGGGAWAVTVIDPRTGEATKRPDAVTAENARVRLPAPPDTRDWVMVLRRM